MTAPARDLTDLDDDQRRAYVALESLTIRELTLLAYRMGMASPRITLAHIEQMRRGS